MDSFILGEDIPVLCLQAKSFPDGIKAAHEELHRMIPDRAGRRFFGISRPEPDQGGRIVYRAAAELLESDGSYGLEKSVIRGGSYNTYYIKDYRENISAIGECFDLLTGQAEIDPNGYCIEWYIGENDVKCMVRCNDKEYPVDNPEMMGEENVRSPKMIMIESSVDAPVETVWTHWNEPSSINKWCTASPDWHTVDARNDLRVGGEFSSRMETIDGSMGFDFGGIYTDVIPHRYIAYEMADGRKVEISFEEEDRRVHIRERFTPESQNSEEMQRNGWQAILDNFKKFVESN